MHGQGFLNVENRVCDLVHCPQSLLEPRDSGSCSGSLSPMHDVLEPFWKSKVCSPCESYSQPRIDQSLSDGTMLVTHLTALSPTRGYRLKI